MRLLVIRNSAMGDVALTLPVLLGMREQFPDVKLVLLTKPAFKPFFTSVKGLEFFLPDFNGNYNGISGLFRLFRDIRKTGKVDYVIDLHDVLRSIVIRTLFRFDGASVKKINKGRLEKRHVITGKKRDPLIHSVERYREVFERAGFKIKLQEGPWIVPSDASLKSAVKLTGFQPGLNIGIAPFSKHPLKTWPEKYMAALLKLISEKVNTKFWLFGGAEESEKLKDLQKFLPQAVCLTGMLTLEEELALISKLNFIISMDSSNMHMGAFTGTRVISIWGATDPVTGFGAWMQPEKYSLRIPVSELDCRPCTVFGKGECRRGDHACMNWLTPELVYNKILNLEIL